MQFENALKALDCCGIVEQVKGAVRFSHFRIKVRQVGMNTGICAASASPAEKQCEHTKRPQLTPHQAHWSPCFCDAGSLADRRLQVYRNENADPGKSARATIRNPVNRTPCATCSPVSVFPASVGVLGEPHAAARDALPAPGVTHAAEQVDFRAEALHALRAGEPVAVQLRVVQ